MALYCLIFSKYLLCFAKVGPKQEEYFWREKEFRRKIKVSIKKRVLQVLLNVKGRSEMIPREKDIQFFQF